MSIRDKFKPLDFRLDVYYRENQVIASGFNDQVCYWVYPHSVYISTQIHTCLYKDNNSYTIEQILPKIYFLNISKQVYKMIYFLTAKDRSKSLQFFERQIFEKPSIEEVNKALK